MNIGSQAGGVHKGALQIHRFGQGQRLGRGGPQGKQFIDYVTDFRLGPPCIIALEGGLAGHRDAQHFTEAAEALEQGAVGQSSGQSAVILLNQTTGDIATQRAPAMALMVLLRLGTDFFALAQPTLEILLHQARFQAAANQQGIDVQQLITELAVVDIALDGGQDLRQREFKGDNGGVRHGDRV